MALETGYASDEDAEEITAAHASAIVAMDAAPVTVEPDPVDDRGGARWVAYRAGQTRGEDGAARARVESRHRESFRARGLKLRTAARRAGLWRTTRVLGCGLSGARPDGTVALRYTRGDANSGPVVGVSGLMACGNGWLCPPCAAKIAARRARKLAAALEQAVAAGGWAVLITLTVRHSADIPAADLVKGTQAGWRRVRSGGAAKAEREALGILGIVRSVEITHGPNGWHPHVHAVVVFDHRPTSGQIADLAGSMFTRWAAGVVAAGCPEPIRDAGGLDVSHLGEHTRPEALAASLTAWARYAVKGISGETVMGVVKDANGQNRSVRQLMDDALVGIELVRDDGTAHRMTDERARDLLLEYERATKAVKQLTGLCELERALGIDPDEATDEDIVAEDAEGEDVAIIAGGYWDELVEPRMAEVIAYGEKWGPDGVRRWLTTNGIPWTWPRHREDGTREGRSWSDVRDEQAAQTARDLAAAERAGVR